MLKPDEMIKRLKPLIGDRADAIWNSYLASDEEERGLIQHSLENLHSQMVDDYKREKLILTPPFKFEHLHGDYPAGMVAGRAFPAQDAATELPGRVLRPPDGR